MALDAPKKPLVQARMDRSRVTAIPAADGKAALDRVAVWWGDEVARQVRAAVAGIQNYTANDVCRAVFQARRSQAQKDLADLADVETMRFTSQVRRVKQKR
jgi:hypothetical protein